MTSSPLIKLALGLVAALIVVALLWFYRPFSPYSPAKLLEFQDPDKAVHNFRNFDEFFPSRRIAASDVPRPLVRGGEPLPTHFAYGGKMVEVGDFIARTQMTGLMVVHDGTVRFEDYYLGANSDSRFTSWSVAKSMVATLIFRALKDGKIASLDDKAATYAPQYAGTDFGDTSLRALLAMSSGIAFDEDYSDPDSDIRNYFFGTFVLGQNSDTLLFDYRRDRPEFSDFTYISPNSHVLASVLRAVHGRPLADIVTDQIWGPMGMTGDAYWSQNTPGADGMALGYCCLNARLADYARFGLFWLETVRGEGIGPDLLPTGIADLVLNPATPDHPPGGARYGGRGYSHHFWLPGIDGVFFANGVYGQAVWIDTRRNVVIARNSADPDFAANTPESTAFFDALARHYGDGVE